jgi:hypothetical protein
MKKLFRNPFKKSDDAFIDLPNGDTIITVGKHIFLWSNDDFTISKLEKVPVCEGELAEVE